MDHYSPDPQRDRRLARQHRLRPRRKHAVAELIDGWRRSDDYRRLQRQRKARCVLVEVLGQELAALVEIGGLSHKGLTLVFADGTLLSEIRNYAHQELLAGMAEAGVGTQTIRYRLKRSA